MSERESKLGDHAELIRRADDDRKKRPWRYYELDRETLLRMLDEQADQIAASQLAAPAREPQTWQPTGVTHRLKIWPGFFDDVASGRKPFELRYNDRDFKAGDELLLQEWENGIYSGRETRQRVTYVLQDAPRFGLHHNAAILGLAPSPSPSSTPEPQG